MTNRAAPPSSPKRPSWSRERRRSLHRQNQAGVLLLAAEAWEDDGAFCRAFTTQTLDAQHWDHRAHLRAAYACLRRYPFEEALAAMRSGILAINRSHALVETAERGYHETLTVLWLRLVASTLRHYGPDIDSRGFLAEQSYLLDKRLPRVFYSRVRMMSAEARRAFVSPDITPLPEPCSVDDPALASS